jgi:hypothetical protein
MVDDPVLDSRPNSTGSIKRCEISCDDVTATQSANTAAQLLLGAAGILGVQTVGSAAVDFVQQKRGARDAKAKSR